MMEATKVGSISGVKNIMSAFQTISTNVVLLLAVFMVSSQVSGSDPPALTKFQVGSKQNPGKSCKDIKAQGGTATKSYYISLNGSLEQVYCDQTTAGGGWTLVYSYTFTNFDDFGNGSNAVTPRPNWSEGGNVPLSTKTPTSEVDFNAMDFNLWKKLGSEFLLKSNLNNWYACAEGSDEDAGSLVYVLDGSINCTLVRSLTDKCEDVLPNRILQGMFANDMTAGDVMFYNNERKGTSERNIITLNVDTDDDEYPTHDSCGNDSDSPLVVPNPHGNIYIR